MLPLLANSPDPITRLHYDVMKWKCVTGTLWGEFTNLSQRPVPFDVFFDLHLNKRWSKHSIRWWFETPSRTLWRHHNVVADHWHYAHALQVGPDPISGNRMNMAFCSFFYVDYFQMEVGRTDKSRKIAPGAWWQLMRLLTWYHHIRINHCTLFMWRSGTCRFHL